MRRIGLLCACALIASCASAPVAKLTPMAETCGDLVRKLEKDSKVPEPEKRKLVAGLANSPFTWKLKLLSLSDQTNPQDMNPPVLVDMECADRPRDANDGFRYLFTVYFDQKYQPDFAKMSRGTVLEVTGRLTSYEGGNSFAARGDSFK
jgi:hypothetical protein